MRRLGWMLAVVGLVASGRAQVLDVKKVSTSGHPTEAMETPDGLHVLVTVNRSGGSSGIDVFDVRPDGSLKKTAFQPLGSAGAQGILLVPHSQVLAVGVSNAGVAFLPLADTLAGKAKPVALTQGEGSGSGYLAVAPDGKTLYVANEYGNGGNLGVIALQTDAAGEMHPLTVAHIPTPRATPGVTISPDGTRVYVVDEIMRADITPTLNGHGVAELERSGCMQAAARPGQPNGVVFTIDATQAGAWKTEVSPEQIRSAAPRSRWFNAGCSPVREVVSADGKRLYVTARGDNRVLVFDTAAMESDPTHAFVRAIPTGGEAPVGLRLFDGDRKLLVANSNRFANRPGNATVIDLTAGPPKIVQTIPTGDFPRNVAVTPDGKRLLLTEFLSDEFLVLTPR